MIHDRIMATMRPCESLLLMQWTAPTRRHLGAKKRCQPMGCECPELAKTYRQSHLLTMSEVAPTPDLRTRMSGIV